MAEYDESFSDSDMGCIAHVLRRLPLVDFSTDQHVNLFNRVNFFQPNPALGWPTFGRSTEVFDAREIQFGIKFIF